MSEAATKQQPGAGMRKLDGMETMAIRIALAAEYEKLARLADLPPKDMAIALAADGHSRAAYRLRIERIENLLVMFSPGRTVTVGV